MSQLHDLLHLIDAIRVLANPDKQSDSTTEQNIDSIFELIEEWENEH